MVAAAGGCGGCARAAYTTLSPFRHLSFISFNIIAMTAFKHLAVNLLTITLFLLVQCNAKTWGFEDATLSISGKKDGVGGGLKEKYSLTTQSKTYRFG